MKIDECAISDGLLWKAWAGGQASLSLRARRETERKRIGSWACTVESPRTDVREAKVTGRSKTEEWGEQLKPVLVIVYTSARIDASMGA